MFRPPSERTRERILIYGSSGVGKSWAALSMAKRAAGSDAKVYVIDSDYAWDRMLEDSDPGNVEVFTVFDWPDYRDALGKIESVVRAQDWVVVDLVGTAWEAVQNYFVQEIHGTGEDEYFLRARKDLNSDKAKTLGALSGWLDWPVINKMYKAWFNRLVFKLPCHLLAITTSERVNTDTDERAVRDLFGPLGGKPGGQKHLPHAFHSVLLFGRSGGAYVMTTAKERGERPVVERKVVTDWSVNYLMGVGKWKP